MNLVELINHPERMDRDTLYELRSMMALHPYFQTVRLLMLQNLYLLHDTSFDEELRRAAVYVSDRRKLFNLVEATHYQLNLSDSNQQAIATSLHENRTMALIDSFLDSIPKEAEEKEEKKKRRPTPKDATVDYVAYLMESEEAEKPQQQQMPGQDLIDHFLQKEQGRILLSEQEDEEKAMEAPIIEEEEPTEEEYFTETLARIYIKQGRYQKALDIIQRLSSNFPEKNVYFADQIRFLEKLIINNNKKQK